MMTSLTIRAFGVVVEIELESELIPLIAEYLPPGWRVTPRSAETAFAVRRDRRTRTYALSHDEHSLRRGATRSEVLDVLEAAVRQYVAEMSPIRIFVHAGVVALNGKAMILPGRSFSGKTTLVRELVESGATYYSDEYAVLDGNGLVHPYPSALAVRESDQPVQVRVPAQTISRSIGKRPIPVGSIVISRYREGARWAPRRLSVGAGALQLLNNTVPARRFPHRVLPVLSRAASHAVVLKSARDDAGSTAEALLGYFSEHRAK